MQPIITVEISDDEVDDEKFNDSRPSSPVSVVPKPLIICSPFSWTPKDTTGIATPDELEAVILLEREVDCVELVIKSHFYWEWCEVKRTLIGSNISLSCDCDSFKTVIEEYVRGSELEYDEEIVNEIATTAKANGIMFLEPFLNLVDTPFHTHELNALWGRRSLAYIKSIAHSKYRIFEAYIQEAFQKGEYSHDIDSAILPADVIWSAFEEVGITFLTDYYKSMLYHRYASCSGRTELKMMKADSLLAALEVVGSIADIWLCRELLGSVTHACSRDLLMQVQSLSFPPRCLIQTSGSPASSLAPSPSCTPRNSANTQPAPITPVTAVTNISFMTNAAKGDVLADPLRYNLRHRKNQNQHVDVIRQACKACDPQNTGHVSTADMASATLHIFLSTLPDTCFTALSVLYNDTAVPLMINYESLLHDISLNEMAYATRCREEPMFHDECCQLLSLLYNKWNLRGRPSVVDDKNTKLRRPEEMQQRIAQVLGIRIPDDLLSLFMWQIIDPTPAPPRLYAMPTVLPDTARELREKLRKPQPLIGSLEAVQSMLEVMDEKVWGF